MMNYSIISNLKNCILSSWKSLETLSSILINAMSSSLCTDSRGTLSKQISSIISWVSRYS